ncbi:DUF4817 domain-containing protein [Trichonephila clavipes]|nr:DUF4817 domain-containing protein [Trichonephila clavipes]
MGLNAGEGIDVRKYIVLTQHERLEPVILSRGEVDGILEDDSHKTGTYILYEDLEKEKMYLAFKACKEKKHALPHLSCPRQQRGLEGFKNTELADMHLIYGLADGNTRAAERLYRGRYPQRDVPDRQMFANLHHNLCEYESL